MNKILVYIVIIWNLMNFSEIHAHCSSKESKRKTHSAVLTEHWTQVKLGEELNGLNWERIAASSNGKHQTAVVRAASGDIGGNIYLSHNYGKTWTSSQENFNLPWMSVSMSGKGKYQTAVAEGDSIYISSNYGKTWQQVPNTQGNWVSVSMSKSGKYQTAVANDYHDSEVTSRGIFISSDYGKTWRTIYSPNSWIAVSVSGNGKLQTATSFLIDGTNDPNNLQGYVYQSKDHGKTWRVNKSLPQGYYTTVTISADGSVQLVGEMNCNLAPAIPGSLFISRNYGKTFHKTSAPKQNWLNCSASHNGRYLLAVAYQQTDSNNNVIAKTGPMMASSDFGYTWRKTDAPLNTWTSVVLAHNGRIATASAWGSGIYIKSN